MTGFEPVRSSVRFPELEQEVLEFWREADVFSRSLRARQGGPLWVFYEGPPTANGRPGIHHVEARTFKDIYPRYRTMTGHYVPRRAGWDCHGLPVELEVERQIGTTGKRDIEAFGIAEFNRRCRISVTEYVEDWRRLSERIGMWIDLDDAYWTMDTSYIESVWWSLKGLHERGLLVEADKVTAYCPRCGTALSDAEVAMGYETVEDPSVFIRLPILEGADADLVDASLVAWTTTPWTLPSNTGVAVDAGASYVLAERHGERFVVGSGLQESVLGEDAHVVREFAGTSLVGARYTPPYANVEGAHAVVAADFVSMDEGSGIVHLAPAFGPEDLAIGRENGWPIHKPVDDAGLFSDEAPEFVRGMFVKDADPIIIDDLSTRGVLIAAATIEHSYPFCWRCKTPLLYYARTSWYVRTTAVKDRLIAVNQHDVNWFPDHIKHGRYGDWLDHNVDWALSRERYWGTPLPIWRCQQGHQTAIGSLEELGRLAGRDVSEIDPHRPAIDEVTFDCPRCQQTATRVPEVIDTWYDSGAMPFAQWDYHPDLGRGIDEFERHFPADFISEAIDQTRGWFYTLMAEGVLHFDSTAYRNVVCLGHLMASDGRKMSKSLGNTFDPWEALERQGADAVRWYMLTSGSPWGARRFGHEVLDDVVRRFMLTLWNVYGFFVTYANADGFDPDSPPPPALERPLIDRWFLSRLHRTIRTARDGLESYDATGAGRAIEALVGDLSNWYVRRSRRRFWNPGGKASDDAAAAFHTLHEALVTIATLLAPFTPFLSEALWRNLAAGRSGRTDSVHLADYPTVDEHLIDDSLEDAMVAARAIVGLGRTVRVDTKTKVRQPLAEADIHYAGDHAALEPLLGLVADELNVRSLVFAETAAEFGRWHAKPDFKVLGPRLGSRVKDVAAALRADEGSLGDALARGQAVTVALPDGEITIAPDEVDLTQQVREGWGVASEGGITVALDLALTEELRAEGTARDLVRLVQEARREAGFEVSDRIHLGIEGGERTLAALALHRGYVAAETLAVDIVDGEIEGRRIEGVLEDGAIVISLRVADAPSAP